MPILSLRGQPRRLGLSNGRLSACPSSPNCVCSNDDNGPHSIEPLQLAIPPADAWSAVEQSVRNLPGTRVVSNSADYLHAECTSRLFGFVDDLELQLRSGEGIVAIRCASRLGHSDFGVNRRRVEKLRAVLRQKNIVR